MTIKRIYGNTLSEARERARNHYGQKIILLEASEATAQSSAFISIMIDEDSDSLASNNLLAKSTNGTDNITALTRSDVSPNGINTDHRAGSKDTIPRKWSKSYLIGDNGLEVSVLPSSTQSGKKAFKPHVVNKKSNSGNYPRETKPAASAQPITQAHPAALSNNNINLLKSAFNKTYSIYSTLLKKIHGKYTPRTDGPVIKAGIKSGGIISGRSGVDNNHTCSLPENGHVKDPVTSQFDTTADALVGKVADNTALASLQPTSAENKSDNETPAADLSAKSHTGAGSQVNITSQKNIPDAEQVDSRLENGTASKIIISEKVISPGNGAYQNLENALVLSGFTSDFAHHLIETVSGNRSNVSYSDIRWHLESTLSKQFIIEESALELFTGLPGCGRTSLINAIFKHPSVSPAVDQIVIDMNSEDSWQPGSGNKSKKGSAVNEGRYPKGVRVIHQTGKSGKKLSMPVNNTRFYKQKMLLDASALSLTDNANNQVFESLAEYLTYPGAILHVVIDSNTDYRIFERLCIARHWASTVRYSFTRLETPENAAKVLQFTYENKVHAGYLSSNGKHVGTGIHFILRKLDSAFRETII